MHAVVSRFDVATPGGDGAGGGGGRGAGLPHFIAGRLAPLLFRALAHQQLSVRENAAKVPRPPAHTLRAGVVAGASNLSLTPKLNARWGDQGRGAARRGRH